MSMEKVVADIIEINGGVADKGLADFSSSLLEKALPVLVHVDPEAAEVVRDELDFRRS